MAYGKHNMSGMCKYYIPFRDFNNFLITMILIQIRDRTTEWIMDRNGKRRCFVWNYYTLGMNKTKTIQY